MKKSVSETQINKFVKLLEQKKLKQAKAYIAKIDNQDPDPEAQQVISKGLSKCLVAKKSIPLGMVTAMYIYKQMSMRCLFDYLQSQSFDEKIHKVLYELCQYNPTGQLDDRGNNYFKQKMNLQKTQQNQIYGNTIVTLALQIVQTMATWYPIDYFSNKASRYAQYYKKLKQNNVKFPTFQQQSYIKPDQNKKFKAGYEAFIARMEQLDENEEELNQNDKLKLNTNVQVSQVKKQPPKPASNKSSNIKEEQNFVKSKADDLKSKVVAINSEIPKQALEVSKFSIKNKQITSNINPTLGIDKPKSKKQLEQIKLQAVLQTNLSSKKNIQASKVSKVQMPKLPIKTLDPIVTSKAPITNYNYRPKQREYTEQQKMEAVMQKDLIIKSKLQQVPKVTQTKKQIKKNDQSTIKAQKKKSVKQNQGGMFILDQPKKDQIKQIKKNEVSKLTQEQPKPIPQKSTINNKRSESNLITEKNPQNKSKQKQTKNIQKPALSPPKKIQEIKKVQPEKKIDKLQQNPPSSSRIQRKIEQPIIKAETSMSPHELYVKDQVKKMSGSRVREQIVNSTKPIQQQRPNIIKQFKQKDKKNQNKGVRRTEENFYKKYTQQIQTKEQSMKTPKKNLERMQRMQKQSDEQKKQKNQRHNSQPKTQKKIIANNLYGINFANKNIDIQNKFKSKTNQTLSDLRHLKTKQKFGNYMPDPIYNQSIEQLLENRSIRLETIPFLPEYFLPINSSMNSLISQSIKVSTSSERSTPFLKTQIIQARLIKSQSFSYILTLHNKGYNTIQIIYSQALQSKYANQFSSQIQIKGQNSQLINWKANSNQFIDIPFEFYTNDPNFKFLDFVLKINNKITTLNLPVTLLDQGFIEKGIDYQDIANYFRSYGKILKSSPINLPSQTFRVDQIKLPQIFNTNNKQSKILGNLSYAIEVGLRKIVKINIFVKRHSQNPSRCQIYALFDNRVSQNQDFAKVLVQLFCFLLSKNKS